MGSNQRGVAYDPNDVARTTIKETNIHDTRTGNMGLIKKVSPMTLMMLQEQQ